MRTFLITLVCFSFAAPLSAQEAIKRKIGNPECAVIVNDEREVESVNWSGGCNAGLAEGTGILEWKYRADAKPSRYEGSVHQGRAHGDGYVKWAGGDQYEGGFSDGKYHGIGTHLT